MTLITERSWQEIIGAIEADECTPFIGAGASAARFQVGGQLAANLAKQLRDRWDARPRGGPE